MILFLAFLGACSNDATNEEANEDSSKNEQTEETTDNEEETEDSNEPVTVKFLFPWGEDLFNQRIVPIDEKLPNILTLNWLNMILDLQKELNKELRNSAQIISFLTLCF